MKAPSEGLKILERLYGTHPNHQGIKKSLINAYIKFGHHDVALDMIDNIYQNKKDVKSLKFQAWRAKLQDPESHNVESIWQDILQKMYIHAIETPVSNIIKLSKTNPNFKDDDIILFCVVYNELIRLPFLLDYYRDLGVTQFIFIDNNSNDRSLEFLLEQDDCHIFWTNESHIESSGGMAWHNYLRNKYINGQWCLFVDADEFLVYPNYEQKKLPDFIKYLETNNYQAVSSFMLDMFPKKLSSQLSIKNGDNLLQAAPYFYNHYQFESDVNCPFINIKGGIFYHLGNIPLPLIKTPLIKCEADILHIQSNHRITPARVAETSSVLLHFKFLGDFHSISNAMVKSKRHWAGGIAYKRYAQLFERKIEQEENFNFAKLKKSIKYQNSQQLVDLGLIKTSNKWENFTK